MIKIAHVVTAYQSVVTILDAKLRALGEFDDLEVTIISSPPDSYEDPRQSVVRHIPVYMDRKIHPFSDLKSFCNLYRVIKKEKFDVVHSHTAKAGFISALAAKMAGVSVICHTSHGLPYFEGQSKKAYIVYRFLEKVACMFRDYLFSQNKRDLAECEKLMRNCDKVLFEGNGVDIECIRDSASKQLHCGQENFKPNTLKLLLLSRLEPVKRIPDFFDTVKLLIERGLNISCVVAGTGYLESELRKMVTEKGLDDNVTMVGFTHYPHGLIAASDIVLLCSEKEGLPRALMEAMALEKPIVASDVLGTQELVKNDITGFLVPLGDNKLMADKIELLARDRQLRAQMGADGLKRVRENFNDVEIAKNLHDFYQKALT